MPAALLGQPMPTLYRPCSLPCMPHSFLRVRVAPSRSVAVPTTVRQPGYLSPRSEVHGLCAPASRRVCLSPGAGAPAHLRTIVLTGGGEDICHMAIYLELRWARLYARQRFLRSELLRTPSFGSSQNSPSTHLGE